MQPSYAESTGSRGGLYLRSRRRQRKEAGRGDRLPLLFLLFFIVFFDFCHSFIIFTTFFFGMCISWWSLLGLGLESIHRT